MASYVEMLLIVEILYVQLGDTQDHLIFMMDLMSDWILMICMAREWQAPTPHTYIVVRESQIAPHCFTVCIWSPVHFASVASDLKTSLTVS